MYGLSNSEHMFDLRWPLNVNGQGQPPTKKLGTLLFQSTIDIHIQNPHKKVGGPLLAALQTITFKLWDKAQFKCIGLFYWFEILWNITI